MWVVGHLGVGGAPLRLEKRDMAIDIKELRKVIADCYWPTSPVTINELLDRLEAAESEALEQARLNGMGSSREAALMAKIDRLRQALMAMTKSYKSVPYAQWSPEMHFAAEVLEETK